MPTAMWHSPTTSATATLTIMHTEVPAELNGRGIGSALVRGMLDIARAQGLKVVPLLPVREGLYRQAPGIRGFAR